MNKKQAIALIDKHKNGLINPVEMLDWVWLRVTIDQIKDEEWEKYLESAVEVLAK